MFDNENGRHCAEKLSLDSVHVMLVLEPGTGQGSSKEPPVKSASTAATNETGNRGWPPQHLEHRNGVFEVRTEFGLLIVLMVFPSKKND